MPFTVLMTQHASRDLEELYDYIALNDAPGKAEQVLARIEKVFGSLSETPQRGAFPRELLAVSAEKMLDGVTAHPAAGKVEDHEVADLGSLR